jgi:hypothetical protein
VNARNVRAALAVIGATVDSVEQIRPAPGWDTCAKVLFHKGTDTGVIVMHTSDDGEISGSVQIGGRGVIPCRTFGQSAETWLRRLVSSMRDGWYPRELDGCLVGTCTHGGGAS